MKKFNRDSKSRFGRRDSGSFGRRRPERSNRGFERQTMHEVTCDKCGNRCEVPFKPTEGKPVYCNDCFRKGGRTEPRDRVERGNELEQINRKLDKILRALEID